MRWKPAKIEVIPPGATRTIKRFPLIPICLPVGKGGELECRWLESASVIQEYGPWKFVGEGGTIYCWKDIYFER